MKLKLPEDPIALVIGKAFHKALELYEKEDLEPTKTFEKEFTKDKVPGVSVEKYAIEKEEALRLLKYWKENRHHLLHAEGFGVVEQEIEFSLKVEKDPLTGRLLNLPPIKGVVDFTTSIGSLGDYKTSSKKYSQEKVDTSDQPTFYYLWYLLEKGELPSKFTYIVFRKGIKREPLQILHTQRTLKQVSDLLSSIQEVVLKIKNGQYYERHSEQEFFCDCKYYEEMLRIK